MQWSAEPGVEADYSDYLHHLEIVDDAQPFPQEVAALKLGQEAFTLEVRDSDNPFLEEMYAGEDDESDSDLSEVPSVPQQTLFASERHTALIELYRRQEMLELRPSDWQMALQIFKEMGWVPERPLEAYAALLAFIKDYEGEAMHHAGEALFAVVRDEPLVSASVQMDLGLFYRISEFAAGGTFIVGRKGAYAEAQASGDFDNACQEEAL